MAALLFAALLLPAMTVHAQSAGTTRSASDDPAVDALLTAPERTSYRETTRYADVIDWTERVAAASPVMHVDTFGYTLEGRPLPLVVVGRLPDGSAKTVRASGRTIVYLQGNIHAGEVEGKETLLMLLREIAQGRHLQLLDSLVLLVAPIYNADGNERVLLTNRPSQHGPIGGMGQRPNAQGYDLNRDHMKLDSPEARSLARMLSDYAPHVGVDLHTTNGTRHAYHLTYSPPLHPGTHPAVTSLLRDEWLPYMTRAIRQKYGWDYYYYGNLQGEGDARGWYTFDHRPRFNNNYIGLRNRIAILSEAYAYLTFEDRITATARFVEEILAYAHANASVIRATVANADNTQLIGERLPLGATWERSPEPVEILMGDVVQERNPYSGATILRRTATRRPERMFEYGTFTATETEVVPAAYILTDVTPPVLANLAAHGIEWRRLGTAREIAVEAFRVDSTGTAAREFQGHHERTLHGAWIRATVSLREDAVVVPLDQPLARLIFTLLEPRSDDGLVNWNFFDRSIDAGDGVPIVRVHEPLR